MRHTASPALKWGSAGLKFKQPGDDEAKCEQVCEGRSGEGPVDLAARAARPPPPAPSQPGGQAGETVTSPRAPQLPEGGAALLRSWALTSVGLPSS